MVLIRHRRPELHQIEMGQAPNLISRSLLFLIFIDTVKAYTVLARATRSAIKEHHSPEVLRSFEIACIIKSVLASVREIQ